MSKTMLTIIVLVFLAAIDALIDYQGKQDFTSIGIIYALCLVSVSGDEKKTIVSVYLFSVFLIIANFALVKFLVYKLQWADLNFLVSLLVVSMSAFLILKRKRADERLLRQNVNYIKVLEEMLFVNSHKLRSPLCSLQGIILLAKDETPCDLNKYHLEIDICMQLLDTHSRELNSFIEHSMLPNGGHLTNQASSQV